MTDVTPDGTLTFERSIRVPPTVSPHAQAVIAGGQAMVVDRLANPATSPRSTTPPRGRRRSRPPTS